MPCALSLQRPLPARIKSDPSRSLVGAPGYRDSMFLARGRAGEQFLACSPGCVWGSFYVECFDAHEATKKKA
eukprot:8467431-Pyramimonas_sp.AAC.1